MVWRIRERDPAAILATTVFFVPPALAFADGIIWEVGGQPVNLHKASGPIRIVKTQGSVSIETLYKVPTANEPTQATTLAGFSRIARGC